MYRDETSHLGIRIENSLKADIERFAKAEDRSVSNWVCRVLAREVERLKKEGK